MAFSSDAPMAQAIMAKIGNEIMMMPTTPHCQHGGTVIPARSGTGCAAPAVGHSIVPGAVFRRRRCGQMRVQYEG